jgi:peptidoglycan/xylan/chitin deacetylase (PgdA/CDA1 family)
MTMPRLWSRLEGASARRLAKWFGRRPFAVPAAARVITFTFDDFPRSSLLAGGALLEQAGFAATYFTSLGLAGETIATGPMFGREDLPRVLARGHELGCHTHDHCPAWETPSAAYLASVEANIRAFATVGGAPMPATHSYPISYPRPATKVRLAEKFRACRGGGQAANRGIADLNYLGSFFLEQCGGDFAPVERVIAETEARGGWLIFSTHDVAENHTRFGCSPAFFARVVERAARSGATVLPMAAALDLLGAPRPA